MSAQEINIIVLTLSIIAMLTGILTVVIINYFILKKNGLIQTQIDANTELQKELHILELSALRSQLNPHFIHNSLNSIQYYIQQKEVELSENYLVKFSRLIRLFFEYSRRQTVSIKEEVDLIENYLDIEQLRFEDKLNFSISIDKKIEEDEQFLPSMLLQPLIENAVNHGLFHKKDGGHITIRFKLFDISTLVITIEDDGIGINKSNEIFTKSSKNYQSRSSAVLHERIEILNQTKNWRISYNIQDVSELKNATGTIVTLTIKQLENL